jgi:hypothetical protein
LDQKSTAYKVTAKSVNFQYLNANRSAASIPLVVVPVVIGRLIGRLGFSVPSENHRSERHHSQIRTAIGATQQVIAIHIEFIDVDIGLALHAYRHRFNLQDLRPETTAPRNGGTVHRCTPPCTPEIARSRL